MVWNPFSRSGETQPVSGQIEQRSHQPINLPQGAGQSDIKQTLEQITHDHENPLKLHHVDLSNKSLDTTVDEFVSAKPNNLFIIDGEKEVKESVICTSNADGGKTCLKLKVNTIELFKTMQKLEYFCSLPDDIDATYFECRKIA